MSFAPLAFKLFYAARQNAVLRRSPFNKLATLDDLRESVATLEGLERITRRVLGGAHPMATMTEVTLRNARKVLRAHETPSPPGTA